MKVSKFIIFFIFCISLLITVEEIGLGNEDFNNPFIRSVEIIQVDREAHGQSTMVMIKLNPLVRVEDIDYLEFHDSKGHIYKFNLYDLYSTDQGELYYMKELPCLISKDEIKIIVYDSAGAEYEWLTRSLDVTVQSSQYDGSWSGTTNQNRDMSFTVSNDIVTMFNIEIGVAGIGICTGGSVIITIFGSYPIMNDSFTITSSDDEFIGTFSSNATCDGTWYYEDDIFCMGSGSGTWDATKNDTKNNIIIGLGGGGGGWIEEIQPVPPHDNVAWPQANWAGYNAANGESYPALCDVDGDGKDEVVIGLGSGGSGWLEIKDDMDTGYAPLAWLQLPWPAYNSANGETRPACGDIDGDNKDEIVIGLGTYTTDGGWLEVRDDATAGYAHLDWIDVRWSDYNNANGETWPACGDVDGDNLDEIVIGLGTYTKNGGWLEIKDDATAGYAHIAWPRVNWSAYNSANGETRPACGDVDGDDMDEIVIGFGTYTIDGGWLEIKDDADTGYSHLSWPQVHWPAYNSVNGETRPAVGR